MPIQFCLSLFHSHCHSPHTGVSNTIWHIFVSQDGTFDGVMSGDTLSPCNTCSLPSHECTCDFAEGVDYYRPGGPRAILEQLDSQDAEATCSPLKFQVISAIEKSPPVSNSSPDVSDDEEQMLARRKRRKCRASTLSDSEASSDTAGAQVLLSMKSGVSSNRTNSCPEPVRIKFKNNVVYMMDVTELEIEKPSSLECQWAAFSVCKQRNTMKFLSMASGCGAHIFFIKRVRR